MSFGRIPELLLAGLIMEALLMVGLWTRMSEPQAGMLLWQEVEQERRVTGYVHVPTNLFSERAVAPTTDRSLESRLWRLYPNYAARLALIRFRLHRIEEMIRIRGDAGRRVPPLALLLLPGLAEAVRRRAVKLTSPIAFPNEIVFHLGLWGVLFGSLSLTMGYVLSPVVVPSGLFLLLLTALLTAGLIAIIANVPGRWRDDH